MQSFYKNVHSSQCGLPWDTSCVQQMVVSFCVSRPVQCGASTVYSHFFDYYKEHNTTHTNTVHTLILVKVTACTAHIYVQRQINHKYNEVFYTIVNELVISFQSGHTLCEDYMGKIFLFQHLVY